MQNRSVIMRIVVLALLLYSLASLFSQERELAETGARALSLEQELRELTARRESLEAKLAGSGREEELRRLARERLGMVMPGETIFYFIERGTN